MAASAEIGRVTWETPVEGEASIPRVAVLRADGSWAVPDNPKLAAWLTGHYRESFLATGPSDGFPGIRELHDWARTVHGTVRLAPRSPDPPGTVY